MDAQRGNYLTDAVEIVRRRFIGDDPERIASVEAERRKCRGVVRVFRYLEELDAFLPTEEYAELARELGIAEWNPVVWIGRLFTQDNDFGEHWFDNWDLREAKEKEAEAMGLDAFELLILDPERFQNGVDGPCHEPELRKRFWTDVLRSLELSYQVLYDEARRANRALWEIREIYPDGFIPDLEERIARVEEERC